MDPERYEDLIPDDIRQESFYENVKHEALEYMDDGVPARAAVGLVLYQDRGFSQETAAEWSGTSRKTVSKYANEYG